MTNRTAFDPYAPLEEVEEFFALPIEVPAFVVETPAGVIEAEPEEDEVPTGSVNTILDWVGDDKERAARALEAEEAGAARPSALKKLKALVD